MIESGDKIGRRQFLGAAGAAGIMIIKPQLVRGTAANSAVRLGLLGCGHRGTHVATSFANNTTCACRGAGRPLPGPIGQGQTAL